MKIRLLFAMVTIAGISHILDAKSCDGGVTNACGQTGRTFLWTRPLFQSNMPEMVTGFRDGFIHANNDVGNGSFQAVLFGSKSRNNENLQRYFTPFGLTKLVVNEVAPNSQATAVQGGSYVPTRNLYTPHFNLFTNQETFQSTIAFEPHQSVVGLGMHYRRELWRCAQTDRAVFFSASSPLTSVRNTFGLQEKIINDGGGVYTGPGAGTVPAVASMVEAFRQSAWKYGKIATTGKAGRCASTTMRRTALADIELKLGFEWLASHRYHIESYVGILVPTGNKPNAEYIFEPIVGAGGHVGLMWGTYLGTVVWQNCDQDRTVRFEGAFHSQYLFSNHQTRSLDLKNRPFSRYLQLYENKEQATQAAALQAAGGAANLFQARNLATPGINLLTRRVKVTPGYFFNANSAVTIECASGWQPEFGYNLFFRRADCVALACPWKVGPAIKHDDGGGLTIPVRTISGFFLTEDPANAFINQEQLTNYDFNRIQESDLDLVSAAQPAIMTHTLYGFLGYRCNTSCYPVVTGGGASIEFCKANPAGLERWVMWAKLGITF